MLLTKLIGEGGGRPAADRFIIDGRQHGIIGGRATDVPPRARR